MAIEVKTAGKDKKFYTKCNNCATELNYKLSDVQKEKAETPADIRAFSFNPTNYITCPECGEKIYISSLLTESEYERLYFHSYGFYGGGCCCDAGTDTTKSGENNE